MKYLILSTVFTVFCFAFFGNASQADEKGYFYTRENAKGKIVHVHFMGPANWLASQHAEDSNLHRLSDLNSLTLNQHTLSEGEMRYVASLEAVVELEIGLLPDEIEVPSGVLRPLGNMKSLNSLSVSANGLTDEDFAFLVELSNLKDFTVFGDSTLSDNVIWKLSELKNLQTLNLKGRFSDAAIASLVIHRNLVELNIDSPLMTERALDAVSLLPKLKKLNGKVIEVHH